jgi:hypothetical protein
MGESEKKQALAPRVVEDKPAVDTRTGETMLVPSWECYVVGNHKRFVPRGQACPSCGRRLLED